MDGLARGILGILIGAAVYSEVYPFLKGSLLAAGDFGKLTIPGLLGVGHWGVIIPAAVIMSGFLLWVDRKGL